MQYRLLLIADAHYNMLEAVHAMLLDLFEAVLMVADHESLLQAAALTQPDLILVDFSLPASRREGVLRSLRLDRGDAPRVIVLSIHDEMEAAREALAEGAAGFVLKRSAATDLLPAVRLTMQGRTYVSPGIEPRARGAADPPHCISMKGDTL
jgi:two-component system, NarL family, response regulator NreC